MSGVVAVVVLFQLELKRPKSGVFVNETAPPQLMGSEEIPYTTYNPRIMQEKFDAQKLQRIDVIEGPRSDLWTWNLGAQLRDQDIDRTLIDANIPPFGRCCREQLCLNSFILIENY